MTFRLQIQRALAFGVALALLAVTAVPVAAQKEKDDRSKKIQIPTGDGVELQGTLWANPGSKRDASVILLHNFTTKNGGSSHQDGWDDLAAALNKEGYTVLSFDFRGFGDSKKVEKSFWRNPINQSVKGARRNPPPETIDYKDFNPAYYINLVNDIAAAKAYLDRRSDQKELNSSNVIVIGAGEGATLGALWMASQFKLARAPGGAFIGINSLDDPDGKDLVCAVWLSIDPKLGNNAVGSLHSSLFSLGKTHKVPMLFMFGQDDKNGEQFALRQLKEIVPNFKPKEKPKAAGFEFTREWGVKNTGLVGSKLLTNSLDTASTITFYLNDNMDKRGTKEARNRDFVKSSYYWLPGNRQTLLGKRPNEEVPGTIPLQALGIR